MANTNEKDAHDLLKAADGALGEIEAVLTKMRKLAVMAARDDVSDKDRAFLQKELSDLASELDSIAEAAEHGGKKLLNGSTPGVFVPLGWGDCVHYS